MVIIGAIGIAIGVIEVSVANKFNCVLTKRKYRSFYPQVFGIIFSCCLTKKIKDDKKRQSV